MTMKSTAALAGLALAIAAPAVHAQAAVAFPSKPIRLIVPYPPGGGSDTISRPLVSRVGENLKQQIVVDNRGGAGGNIGMEIAAKSVKELIAAAKARPNQITYASSGNGSGGHLANELLNHMANVKMLHVPYKGGGPALVDLLGGQVQVLFATWVSSKPHIESGRVRALGVSTSRRLTGVDLPTIAEEGLPGFDAGVWYAFLAPAGTPRDIVMKLNGEILRAANAPEYRKILSSAAIEFIGSTPEELAKFMKSELSKWARVVKEANVHVD